MTMPRTPEELRRATENMTFLPDQSVDEMLLPEPPAEDADLMVTTSFRVPMSVHQRLRAEAKAKGVDVSTLLRSWIDKELAVLDDDVPVSKAEVLRLIEGLRPMPHAS